MSKNFRRINFEYRTVVINEHLRHLFIESQKKKLKKNNEWGIKININLVQKMIILQNLLMTYIPHTLEFICINIYVN